MNADTIAAIQAARLDFQALLGRPWAFADSPSMNAPQAPDSDPTPATDPDSTRTVCQNVMLPVTPTPAPQAAPTPTQAPTVPAGWRVLSARFSSRCGSCGGYIAAGDSILYRKGSKALHDRCAPGGPAAPVSTPAPAAAGDSDQPSGYRPEAAVLYDGTPGSATLPTPTPAAPKPAGKGRTRKAAQKAQPAPQAAPGATIAPRALAPIVWSDDAF